MAKIMAKIRWILYKEIQQIFNWIVKIWLFGVNLQEAAIKSCTYILNKEHCMRRQSLKSKQNLKMFLKKFIASWPSTSAIVSLLPEADLELLQHQR